MANRYFLNIGANWGDTANWSDTSGGTGGFSVPTNADDVFFDANSGNCTVNASNRVAKTLDFTGYTNTITMTFGITVSGSVTLVAAMTIAGASGLTINATGTFTSNGKTWANALTFSATNTLTLADDLSVGGLLTISGATTVNGSFNINCSSGISLVNSALNKGTGTPLLYLLGGTATRDNNNANIKIDTYINGDITINSLYLLGASLIHISGNVINTPNNLVRLQGTFNIDAVNIKFNNVLLPTYTMTLLSNLNIYGVLETTGGTVNGDYNINCFGGIQFTGNNLQGTGTTSLNLYGGNCTTSTSLANTIQIDTYIFGNIKLTGVYFYYITRTLTYISGKVEQENGNNFRTGNNAILINLDKINFKSVIISGGQTITMNKFFSGSAITPTRIQSNSTVNYTISFQDGFEKITKFTKISNCTVTNRGQLLCITDKSNKGGNIGVRYINQMPNGLPKNNPSTTNPIGYATSTYLLSDPNTILN